MMLIVTAVLSVLILTMVVLLVRQIGSGTESLPVTTEWLDDLSDERYRPMVRLLDESDFRFLRAQKGFIPAMERKLRRQRVEVFRSYLGLLESDFKRVCLGLKIVLVQFERDRPDLASALINRQLTFAYCVLQIQARLILFRWGLAAVDASELIRMFDGMRVELKALVPMGLPVAA
ncbi:MAG: hypothetical protein JWP63_1858 [Candidatus Solibacter sp.]|nr:hypothetical protein [Candidatus Solibacter sp.]